MSKPTKRHIPFKTVTDGMVIEFYCGRRAWNRERDKHEDRSKPECQQCARRSNRTRFA